MDGNGIAHEEARPLDSKVLRGNSLESLVLKVVDCQATLTSQNMGKLRRQGLTTGHGIRQGLSLSLPPANLAFADFSKEIAGRNIEMVRYADDLVLFFRNEEDALDMPKYLELLLATFELSIPEIATGSRQKSYRDLSLLNFWDVRLSTSSRSILSSLG